MINCTCTTRTNDKDATFIALPARSIESTSRVVNNYNDESGVFANLISGTEITAEFGADGNLTGIAGCNNCNAGFEVEGEKLTIGPIATSLMMCQEPEGVKEQESVFFASLENAEVYKKLGLLMAIWGSDGGPVA